MRVSSPKGGEEHKKRGGGCMAQNNLGKQPRHELALDMLREKRELLPHAWVTGDDEMGRSSRFRGDLRALAEQYLLAVPSNTTVRDLDAAPPEYGGRGPKTKLPFAQVRAWQT